MPSVEQLQVGEGRTFNLSVIFVDLVDSTNTISKLSLSQTSRWLVHFLVESTRVIRDYGGQIEKYSGDRVLGLFGTEGGSYGENAISALYCSLAIKCVIKKVLNPFYKSINLPEAKVKVGIDYGIAQIDKVGIRGDSELSAIGDCVNIASKLENLAKENEVLLGNGFRDLLDDKNKGFCEKQTPPSEWTYQYTKTKEKYPYYRYTADFDVCWDL